MTFKELLDIAKEQLAGLSSLDNPDYRLEHAEYKDDDGAWDVIVSYLVENTNMRTESVLPLAGGFQYHRIYQKLRINDDKSVPGLYMYNAKS